MKRLAEDVRQLYEGIPPIFKPFIPSMVEVLRKIPNYARKYTLDEIIEALQSELGELE